MPIERDSSENQQPLPSEIRPPETSEDRAQREESLRIEAEAIQDDKRRESIKRSEDIMKIDSLRREIMTTDKKDPQESYPEIKDDTRKARQEKIEKYKDHNTPPYLKKGGVVSNAMAYLFRRSSKFEIEGKENVPENGPYIVICNHFGGGDAEAISETFKASDIHLLIAKNIWWDRSPIVRWFLKKLKMIPIDESLSNLNEQQKEEALRRQDKYGQKVFREIIEREKQGKSGQNMESMKQAVASLLRGESLGVFPEGLWINPEGGREKKEMKKGYRGIELIAREFKRLTGQSVPIIPTAFIEDKVSGKKKLIIGTTLDSEKNDTDACMKEVAKLLPSEQRGYYQ